MHASALTNADLFFKTYLFTAFVYLLLVSVVVLIARRLERRLAIPGMA